MGYRYLITFKDLLQKHEKEQQERLVVKVLGEMVYG